jgi:hypothetical protein
MGRRRAVHVEGAAGAPVRPHQRRGQLVRAGAVLLLAACAAPETFSDVCAQANNQVESCGATVPTLSGAPCTGLAKFLSTCITQQAASCDDLAALMRDPSRCFPDGGDDVYPGAEELPLPNSDSPDAGASTP